MTAVPQANQAMPFSLDGIVNTINLGIIIIDADENILLWNDWVARHSGVVAGTALGQQLSGAFKETISPAFLSAVRNTLRYGLPVVLSNALHRTPLPLYQGNNAQLEMVRMHQAVTLTAITNTDTTRSCLIQISDSSNSIKREKMLRSYSEILKKEATTDSLTGLYNRRFFDEHYKIALGQSSRQKLPLSVFMLDIDFFKDYNDFYGHPAGDRTLIKVAGALKAQLSRASDVVARYGGEEFILMLPTMQEEKAIEFGERLRLAIWNMAIPHLRSKICQQISVSIGISTYPQDSNDDISALIQAADTALYKAKQLGRNQVFFLPLSTFVARDVHDMQADSKSEKHAC